MVADTGPCVCYHEQHTKKFTRHSGFLDTLGVTRTLTTCTNQEAAIYNSYQQSYELLQPQTIIKRYHQLFPVIMHYISHAEQQAIFRSYYYCTGMCRWVNNYIHNFQHLLTLGSQNNIHCILSFWRLENTVYATVQRIWYTFYLWTQMLVFGKFLAVCFWKNTKQ